MRNILAMFGIRSYNNVDMGAAKQATNDVKDARRELSRSIEISTTLANSVTEMLKTCDLGPRQPVRARRRMAHR